MVGESCDVFTTSVLVIQMFAVSCVKVQVLTHLFVKVTTSTRKQRRDLFSFRVKLPLTTKGRGNLATYLQLRDSTRELTLFVYFYTILSMFNNKQETVITNSLLLLS